MKYPHIASLILGSPLMLARHKLNTILSVISPRLDQGELVLDGEYLLKEANHPSSNGTKFTQHNNVGVVQIHGSLMHRSLGMDALSGLMSYTEIENSFLAALENDQVEHIVLDIDSPGGEVNGVFDLVDRIYEARQIKPITALINESGFSAAFALASAANTIIVPRTAGVGSIGVIAAHIDQSEHDKQNGLAVTTVFAGDRKNDLSPHAPLTDEALINLQQQVDDTYDLFVDTVARNRGLSVEVVKNTQAGIYFGGAAVDIGLADAVSPIHHALTQLHQEAISMTEKTPITPSATPQPESQVDQQTKQQSGTESQSVPSDQNKNQQQLETEITTRLTGTLTNDILKAERARTTRILNACATMNRFDMAMNFIEKGSTVEEASHQILNTLADESDQSQISSTVTPYPNSGEENPLIKNAQQRANNISV